MYEYRIKKVPAVIRWQRSASITSEILAKVFQSMNHHEIFPRSPDAKLFALIDGHSSCLAPRTIDYKINDEDGKITEMEMQVAVRL